MGLVFLFTQPLYLLTTAFSPFTFKVIIGRYVLIVILVTVFRWVFLVVFLFVCFFLFLLLSSLVIWCLSLVLCLDSFLFFVCVSIIDFWFVATKRFIYRNLSIYLSIYLIVLSCWSINFKHIVTLHHLYSPPLMITVSESYFTYIFFHVSCICLLWI